jgi:hypothetical protein
MNARRDCESCMHFRRTRPEPFSASDLRNPEVMEEASKWKEHLTRREQKEIDAYRRGGTSCTFSYEPWFYAWCAHYSSPVPETVDPRAPRAGVYVLAKAINPQGECPAFEARQR